MVTGKVNNHLSAFGIVRISKENRESGATPERYRHCKRGGGRTRRKPVIGIFPEKAVRQPVRCKVRITAKDGLCTAALQVWGAVAFDAENRLRQWVHCRSFLVFRLPDWGFPLAPSRIALPGNRSACDFLRGEFAHSPRFLLPDGSKK